MSEKDLEKDLNDEELDERVSGKTAVLNGDTVSLDDEASAENESAEWKFDAEVPTLDDSLELKGGFELDIPSEEVQAFNPSPAENKDTATITVNKKPIKIIFAVLAGLVVAAVLIFFGVRYYTVPNTEEKMNPGNIALTIGDTDISVGMYDYFYSTVAYEAEQYAAYGYNNLDTTKDYSQQFTEDAEGNQITWLEKLKLDTIERIKTIMLYYEKGEKAGITLTDEQKKTIDSQIESLEANAANSEKSVNEYIQEIYGENCGVATLRSYLEKYFIAGSYFNQMSIDNRPADEDIEAYFGENKENYLSCTFALIETPYNTESDETKAQSVEKIKDYVSRISSVDDMKELLPEASKEFIEQYISMGYFEDEAAAVSAITETMENTEKKSNIETHFGKEIGDWLFSSDTPVGSATYYLSEDNGAAAIILKTGEPQLDDAEVYSVRHILIIPEKANADENADNTANTQQTETEYTEEEWNTAKAKADEILAEYNNGEKTEKSFALLAEANSQDTESTSKGTSGIYGGAYEGVALGQMVPEFEGWATDKSRKLGDVDIVKSQYGYHIMYFIFDGPSWKYSAQSDLMQQNQQKEFDSIEVKEHRAMSKVKVAKPSSDASQNGTQGSAN